MNWLRGSRRGRFLIATGYCDCWTLIDDYVFLGKDEQPKGLAQVFILPLIDSYRIERFFIEWLGINPADTTNRGDRSVSNEIVVDIQETLSFFDEVPKWAEKQATSIVAVIGEDLAAGCFRKHLESEGATVCVRYIKDGDCIYPESVTTGRRRGPRLDRWIVVDRPDGGRTVFQTEIKNSSAQAFGGETIALNAPPEDFRDYTTRMWQNAWDPDTQSLRDPGAAKVLKRMRIPNDLSEECVKPLLICWIPITPENEPDSFLFQIATRPGPDCDFSELWVFSISSYLRSLGQAKIALKMPVAAARLRILDRLLSCRKAL